MKEIRLIPDQTVYTEYIENLVFLLELYPYIHDENLKNSIEERINHFNKGEWINVSKIDKKYLISLYWDYVKMADDSKSFFLIDSDV